MDTDAIVVQLKAERGKLDAAIRALEGAGGSTGYGRRRGRPPGSKSKSTGARLAGSRRMSAAARKRIAEAMRKRWAAVKSGQKIARA